jgi:hypothetical protein
MYGDWVRILGTLLDIKQIQNIFRVDIQLYQHEWKLGNREIVWNIIVV